MMLGSLIRLFGQSNPTNVFRFFGCRFADDLENMAGGGGSETPPSGETPPAPPTDTFSWKEKLGPDLMNAPMLKTIDDNKDGLTKLVTNHVQLEKLLGHEKVPIPKGPEDVDGWNQFSKAMGIPDTATQYGLKDAEIPAGMEALSFDKNKFAETVHAFKLTPRQAEGLWGAYQEIIKDQYHAQQQEQERALTETINRLRGEWGDAYDANVQLGQLLINKFSPDQAANDWLTVTLAAHPIGVKFLASIGKQFSENKIGEFKYQNFSMAPDDAQVEIDKIINDPNHPYNNEKSPVQERNRAIDYVNSLYGIIQKGKQR